MRLATIRRSFLIAAVGFAALLGSTRTASACPPVVHQYGVHGFLPEVTDGRKPAFAAKGHGAQTKLRYF